MIHNKIKFLLNYDIQECQKNLGRLQQKLARYLIIGEEKSIQKISQRILKSEEARVLAIHRVTSNYGSRSPGLSERIPNSSDKQYEILNNLKFIINHPRKYKSKPLDRIYIDKPSGGKRPISIPSYFDRCLQALYTFVLDVYCENTSDINSYGFRGLRNQHHAIKKIQFTLNTPNALLNYAYEIDIKRCFDKISHDWLINNIPMNSHILNQWLKCGYIERGSDILYKTEEGTPQGSLISQPDIKQKYDKLVKKGIISE